MSRAADRATGRTQKYGDLDGVSRRACGDRTSICRSAGIPACRSKPAARLRAHDTTRDVLELHGATKRPASNAACSRTRGRSPSSVHLYEECHIGGGFGVRGRNLSRKTCSCALRRCRQGRAGGKWIEDRRENLMACNRHSRQQHHRIRAAVDAEAHPRDRRPSFPRSGRLCAHQAARVADGTAGTLKGPYRVPAYRVTGHFRLTNKTPAATYRAPGRYGGRGVRVRAVARTRSPPGSEIDRIEVRRRQSDLERRNALHARSGVLDTELTLDSGDLSGLLDKVLAKVGWDDLEVDLERRRAAGRAVGVGIARNVFVEKRPRPGRRRESHGRHEGGRSRIVTGAASLGQGFETVIAQICADALGVDYRNVRVVHDRGSVSHRLRLRRARGARR